MKRIEAIIRPLRLEGVKAALAEAGLSGMTVTDVRGCGKSGGQSGGSFRGEQYIIRLPPKIKLELIVRDTDVDLAIETLLLHARTGEPGDGWVWVLPCAEARRIRTGEEGDVAL